MGFEETGNRLWLKMSISDRVSFLRLLEKAIKREPKWWDGLTLEDIARIPSFDDLPSDLRGRLIMAITPERFSITEQKRVQEILIQVK